MIIEFLTLMKVIYFRNPGDIEKLIRVSLS